MHNSQTVKMAAKVESRGGTRPTKVTFNRANNQTSASTASQLSDTNHEMHIKMSKKIAQLTKVIYSLNSKNDEHEEVVECLKNAHEEEVQKVMLESKEKITHYKQKMELFKEQESLISRLQCLLEEEREEKRKFIDDFDKFKVRKSEMETEITKKYESKLNDVSSKLSVLKDEYENRTQKFQSVTKNLEAEKEKIASDLSHKHSIEMDKLIKAHRVRFDELKNENNQLQKNIENLHSNNSSTVAQKTTEIEKLEKENDIKCAKLKSFYENELEAAKKKHRQIVTEMEDKCKKEVNLQELSSKRCEQELRNRIRGLTENNEQLEAQIEEMKSTLTNTKQQLDKTANNKDDYSREVSILKQNLSTTEMRIENLQNELETMKGKFDLQNKELLKKSAELGSLEALKIANIGTINELKTELSRVNGICNNLEAERKNLGSQLSESSTEADQQIKVLQRDLGKAVEEQRKTVSKYEQMLTNAHEKHTQESKDIIKNKDNEISLVIEKHTTELKDLKTSYEKELEELQVRITDEKNQEIIILKQQNETVLKEKMDEITKLTESCSKSATEIVKLNSLLNDQKSNQESTTGFVQSLEDKVKETNSRLNKTEEKLGESHQEVKNLKDELASKQNQYSKLQEKAAEDLKRKLKELANELDSQWAKKLRAECDNLRSDLNRKYQKDNESAMSHMAAMKDGEIEAYKTELQLQISKYQDQITDLKSNLQSIRYESEKLVKRNAEEFNLQKRKYEEEIAKQKFQHRSEVEDLYLENERNLKSLSEKHSLYLKGVEEKLKSEHQENISSIMLANRAAIDSVKEEAKKCQQKELDKLSVVHTEEKDVLRHTMHLQHQDTIEQINLEFEEEIRSVKQELQKTKDLRSKEFEIHAAKIEELNNAIAEKEEQMIDLEQEFQNVQQNIKTLNQELESKVEDIRKARREGNLNLRRREQQLAKEHQNEVDSITAEHLRETQRMLAEFNKAKELLKDKIEALQMLLEQAEENYRNRDSRPEDLEKIEKLKTLTAEREMECRKLVEEKRYFQMELLNRETNFNKIFNNFPNVGVMNPLDSAKKKRKGSKENWNSAGSRRSNGTSSGSSSPARLDPLPHPQIHEQRLNNSKPLPKAPVHGN